MLDLASVDRIDGSSKVEDLRSAIGCIYSDNYSSTSRSRLVGVSECGEVCFTEEARSEYSSVTPRVGIVEQPSWLVWNGIFF